MDYRPRLEARRGMNVRARLDSRRGMDARTRLNCRFAKSVAAIAAAVLIRRVHGLAQHAHQAQVQRGGDQIDGAQVHARGTSKSCARPVKLCAGCENYFGLSGTVDTNMAQVKMVRL